ncbi:Ca2+ regulator and membrane fusion protein Fig1-domain-containing protein [Aspergillus karnatakaensis]|uniref:Fig1 domain-containing protein n=1 Tax=Aspergillus karnatakaensis TaxID=1810916 RepID=UPI003CCCC5C5
MQGSEPQPEESTPSGADDVHHLQADDGPPSNQASSGRRPSWKLGLRQKLRAKWRKQDQQSSPNEQQPDEQQIHLDELIQGAGEDTDEETTAATVLLGQHSQSASVAESSIGYQDPTGWGSRLRRRAFRYIPMIGYHHMLMFISMIAITFLSLVLAGCSSQSIPNIYLLELSYVPSPDSNISRGHEVLSPSFYTLVANFSSAGALAARVGYFGICMNPNADGQSTGWLCQSSAGALGAVVDGAGDPLNLLTIADSFRDKVIVSMMMIISMVLLFLSICTLASFPGWRTEFDDSGSEIEVKQFPARPMVQLVMAFQILAACVLVTAMTWQHIAVVAQVATTEAAFGGAVKGGVGDVAMGLGWGALAANVLVVVGTTIMMLNLRLLRQIVDDDED